MKGKRFRIKGNSDYFKEKYGTSNPIIEIRGEDTEVWPNGGWEEEAQTDNPACIIFGYRCGVDRLPFNGKVYYGHIQGPDLGELVHETELEPWGEEGEPPRCRGNPLEFMPRVTFETSDPALNPVAFKIAKEWAENLRGVMPRNTKKGL